MHNYAIVHKQDGVENKGLTVATCFKVYNKKQNEQADNFLKFTINMYNKYQKTYKMNINGNRVDILANDIFGKSYDKIKINIIFNFSIKPYTHAYHN